MTPATHGQNIHAHSACAAGTEVYGHPCRPLPVMPHLTLLPAPAQEKMPVYPLSSHPDSLSRWILTNTGLLPALLCLTVISALFSPGAEPLPAPGSAWAG